MSTTINQDLLKMTRQREFLRALSELHTHKDISEENMGSLINHHAVQPIVLPGITGGWCDSKEEAFLLSVTELKYSLEQLRQRIKTIKDEFKEKSWHEDEDDFRLSPKMVSSLGKIDASLQGLLDDCLEIDKRGK